jgi:hypothetical protein
MLIVAWFHWWWDPTGLARAQVVAGVLGGFIALAAIILAWLVARKQIELMKKQDKFVQDQAARRAELALIPEEAIWNGGILTSNIRAINIGAKGASGFVWFIYIPISFRDKIGVYPIDDEESPSREKDGDYLVFSKAFKQPIYQGLVRPIAQIRFKVYQDSSKSVELKWKISAEDGLYPSTEELGTLKIVDPKRQ